MFICFLYAPVLNANQLPYKFISAQDYAKNSTKIVLIDVRSPESRKLSNGQEKNALWINPYKAAPLKKFFNNYGKEKVYAIFCSCLNDQYAIRAAQLFYKHGYTKVFVIKNGYDALKSIGLITPMKGEKIN